MTSVDKYRSMYFSALMDYPFDFPVAHSYVKTSGDPLGNDVGISIQCNMPPGEKIYGVTSFLTQTTVSGGAPDAVNERCTGPGGTFIPCP